MNEGWGTDPKKNGTWGGVLGGVVNGDFDASFSLWAWTSERYDLLDFIPILTLRMVLASKKAMTLSIWHWCRHSVERSRLMTLSL